MGSNPVPDKHHHDPLGQSSQWEAMSETFETSEYNQIDKTGINGWVG